MLLLHIRPQYETKTWELVMINAYMMEKLIYTSSCQHLPNRLALVIFVMTALTRYDYLK